MNSVSQLAEYILSSKSSVFFGGAGVSTESGIPDFRSEKGLYSAIQEYGYSPEVLLSHETFIHDPSLFFRYYRDNLIYSSAKPNAAHLALAKLEQLGLLNTVITQNIDGLHQAAGSRNVLELHGSNLNHYCINCSQRYELSFVLEHNRAKGDVPVCERCGGIVRPDVVLYGENLNEKVIAASAAAIASAELLIVGGTSLVVYPAAGLLRYFTGDKLVLINRTKTSADREAKLVINDSIGPVLDEAVSIVTCG